MYKDSESHGLSVLYHYTSLASFLDIIRTRTMRASSVHYLNDARESRLGLELLRDQVRTELYTASEQDRAFLEYLAPWLEDHYSEHYGVFVLCFSEERDQLGQWRGYTPHNAGVSFAINISNIHARTGPESWTFHNCRYKRESQLAYLHAILTRMRREATAPNLTGVAAQDHFGAVLGKNLGEVWQLAAMVKDRAFSHEKEVRFISPAHRHWKIAPRVHYRAANTTLIPYIDFSLADSRPAPFELLEVMVGPSPSAALSRLALVNFLDQEGVTVAQGVSESAIPYRQL